jgi:ribosomal protein L12E/L44/L45/RPP1/RPP2
MAMTTIQTTQAINSVQTGLDEPAETVEPTSTALLPAPLDAGLGGDSMATLAMLITQADEQDSASARKLQDVADSAAITQDDQRVAQMMDKANQDQLQGLATGIGDIVGGVATGVGGCLSDGTGEAAKAADGSTRVNDRAIADGIGKAMPGLGTIVASGYKAAGDRDDARAAQYEAGAQIALHQYDEAHGAEQAADASVQKVAQFLQTLQQSQNESRSAAASMLKG